MGAGCSFKGQQINSVGDATGRRAQRGVPGARNVSKASMEQRVEAGHISALVWVERWAGSDLVERAMAAMISILLITNKQPRYINMTSIPRAIGESRFVWTEKQPMIAQMQESAELAT